MHDITNTNQQTAGITELPCDDNDYPNWPCQFQYV